MKPITRSNRICACDEITKFNCDKNILGIEINKLFKSKRSLNLLLKNELSHHIFCEQKTASRKPQIKWH